ncbi:MAG: SpoIIE family protein phosphatase [Patescibacteria group bacterium]|nr:SpoIIE family protein phosphatase [Patescibacteria group bacterium]
MNFRLKLILVFSFLIALLTLMVGAFIYNDKKQTLSENLHSMVYNYTITNVQNIIGSYEKYYDTAFLNFKKAIRDIENINTDVSYIQIYSYDGDLLYDSVYEKEFKYDGSAQRKVSRQDMLVRVQDIQPTVLYSGDTHELAKNTLEFAPENLFNDREIEDIVYPYLDENSRHEYSVRLGVDYSQLKYTVLVTIVSVAITGVLILLFAMVIVSFIAARLTKPLKHLEKATDHFAKGEYNYRIDDLGGKDEIAHLADSFNTMAENIEKQQKEILERKQEEAEVDKAKDIAEKLNPLVLPEVPHMDISAMIRSASKIGGDLYDVFQIPGKDEYIIYMGDVSGHGIPAGMVGALANAVIYSNVSVHQTHDLLDIINKTNTLLTEKTPKSEHMTLLLAKWIPATRTLEYVSGGHDPFLFIQSGELKTGELGGMMLAKFPEKLFSMNKRLQVQTLQFQPGDSVLFFTDGIPEAWNEAEEKYTDECFQESFVEHASDPENTASDIRHQIIKDVDDFRGGYEQMDDISVVAMRVK